MDDDTRKSFGYVFLGNDTVSSEIEICDAGFERCNPGHTYGPTVRNYYLFHLIVSGKGTFTAAGSTYALDKNKAFFIRPNTLHVYSADDEEPWYYVWLGFKGRGAAALSDKAVGGSDCVFDVDPEFIYELEGILKTGTDNMEVLFRLTGILYRFLGSLYASRTRDKQPRPDIVKSAVKFIENNYFRPFDITWLAKELGMSRAHFSTVFSAAMGASPYNYLTKYRISKAEKLLTGRTGLTVTEVAYSVGFASIERFSEMFKKYTGFSPLAYRRQYSSDLT